MTTAAVLPLSVVQPQAFPGLPLRELPNCIERLSGEFGVRAVEVTRIPDAQLRGRVREAVLASDTEVIFLAGLQLLGNRDGLNAHGAGRARAVSLVRQLIDEAGEIGATRIMVTSGRDPIESSRPDAFRRLTESLAELCEYAADRTPPMSVSLEPTDRSLDHRQLVGPISDALAVIGDVGTNVENLELNVDLSHLLQLGENLAEAIQAAAGACRHVHLANWARVDVGHPLYGDTHPPFGLQGSEVGSPQLADFIGLLIGAGYFEKVRRTLVGVEVRPLPGADPWSTLREAVAVVTRAWSDAWSSHGRSRCLRPGRLT